MTHGVFYYRDFNNKLVSFRRLASPNEHLIRLRKETDHNPEILHYVRQLPDAEVGGAFAPADPNATWFTTAFNFGINPNAVPRGVDLTSPRVGRAVRWAAELGSHDVAIFPACAENPLCPPFPGIPPNDLYNPCSPKSCFSDGGLGKHDPRNIPQLYDRRRQWLGYHKAPKLIPSHGPHDQHAGRHWRQSNVTEVYNLPATEFYQWYWPGQPSRGGFYVRHLLDLLFASRRSAESLVLQNIFMMEKAGVPIELSEYDLPWYDELEWEDTLKWLTWAEGRDAIGRTCLYVAELNAFAAWIDERRKNCRFPLKQQPARYSEYMGVWCGTISSAADWAELQAAGVPIYVITLIPPGHALGKSVSIVSELDGDEHYRQNAYDAAHQFPNPLEYVQPEYTYVDVVALASGEDLLPLQLSSPPPVRENDMDPDPVTSWRKRWTSYIFLDPTVPNLQESARQQLVYNPYLPRFEEESQLLAPFLPPGKRILTVEDAPHPFFYLAPQAKERHLVHYTEMHDPQTGEWWFEKAKAHSYPANAVIIHSNYPFPGRHPLFCRVFKVPTHSLISLHQSRSYFWTRPKSGTQPNQQYLWEYKQEIVDRDGTIITEEDPETGEQEADARDILMPDAFEVTGSESFDGGSPNPIYEAQDDSTAGTMLVWEKRVEQPIKGDNLASTQVTPWLVPGTQSSSPLWPIRIANLHGETGAAAVVSLLTNTCQVRRVDVLIICTYEEVDTTHTIDVALRHYEDALWVWCRLHGVEVDERYLDVYPLQAMRGKGQVLDVSNWTRLDADARLTRWSLLQHCSEAHPDRVFDRQLMQSGVIAMNQGADEGDISEQVDAFTFSLPSLLELASDDLHFIIPEVPLFESSLIGDDHDVYSELEGSLVWIVNSNASHTSAKITPSHSNSMASHSNSGPSRSNSTHTRPDPTNSNPSAFPNSERSMSRRGRDSSQLSLQRAPHGMAKPYSRNYVYDCYRSSHGHDHSRNYAYDSHSGDDFSDRDTPPQLHSSSASSHRSYGALARDSGSSDGPQRKHKQAKRAQGGDDPAKQQSMNATERRSHIAVLKYKARLLCESCKIELPPFTPPTVQRSESHDPGKLLNSWWDWLDKCRHILDVERSHNVFDYDWSTVDLTFGHLAKLQGLYGTEYTTALKALKEREPWRSNFDQSVVSSDNGNAPSVSSPSTLNPVGY